MTLIHCDDVRSIVEIKDGFIHIDENRLDLFSKTSKVIPHWESKVTLPPYESLSKIYLDIETLRIPPGKMQTRDYAKHGRIMMIGTRNEQGKNLVHYGDERSMLIDWLAKMDQKRPDLMFTHNGFAFDIPYMHERFLFHNLRSPFRILYDKKQRVFQAAHLAGRPYAANFWNMYCYFGNKQCLLIDTMYLAISHDAVFRNFDSVNLKSLPIQLGLRESERLDLGIEGIEECYREKKFELLSEYQIYDLEDTQLLADYFMPALYSQLYFFSGYNLQQLAVVGGGSKWQMAIASCYPKEYVESLPDVPKLRYKGALTYSRCGFFQNVIGVDLSGAYPAANMHYGIASDKDPELWSLAILKSAVAARNSIKYKKNPSQYEKDLAKAAKPVVNSQYGSCASKIPFGDPVAAAITTAFTRARLIWYKNYVESKGGVVVLQDTDSCFFYIPNSLSSIFKVSDEILGKLPSDNSDFLSAATVATLMIRDNPPGVDLDIDSVNKVLFIPPILIKKDYEKSYKFKTVNGKKFVMKTLNSNAAYEYLLFNFSEEKINYNLLKQAADKFDIEFPSTEGLRKNYIKLLWDSKANDWVVEMKGRFIKRDRIKLEKSFQLKYILQYIQESPESAEHYYAKLVNDLINEDMPIDDLIVKRKIRINEKRLVELGLGQPRETISFYQGPSGPTTTGPYDPEFYLHKLERLYSEITEMIQLCDRNLVTFQEYCEVTSDTFSKPVE